MNPGKFFCKACLLLCMIPAMGISGCATFPGWIAASGPSREQVLEKHETGRIEGILLVDVNDALARELAFNKKLDQFDKVFPNSGTNNYAFGPGDVLEVSLWEAPPAMLFGSMAFDANSGVTTTGTVTFPAQMVGTDGTINMPFAGRIRAKGSDTNGIEKEIAKRLEGKANQPQVLVRVIKNNASNVIVVGDVANSISVPLAPKGECLLDALATSGGVKKEVNHTAVQLSRKNVTAAMPLESIIRDPKQNILLKPGDVITALFQPQSFSVLGATGKNAEVPFETQGISLAQALARSGGLIDNRADARGVFIFRFEDAKLVAASNPKTTPVNNKVPVVYQVYLRDPVSFFVTQNFPVQNQDVIYVANSPTAEYEKFPRLVVSTAMPAVTINRTLEQL